MAYFYLAVAFTFNAVANIFLKTGASKEVSYKNENLISMVFQNYYFLFGIFFFALNVVFYFLALKNIPISVAYPLMVSMSLLIINTWAYIYFKENLHFMQIIGYLALILGIFLIYRFS